MLNFSAAALRRFTFFVFLFTLLYGITRRHLLLEMLWEELPLITLGKAFAWTALNHIGLSFVAGAYRFFHNSKYRNYLFVASYLMNTGIFFALLHILIILFTQNISDNQMSIQQSFSILFASTGFLLLIYYLLRATNIGFINFWDDFSQRLYFPVIILALLAAHPFLWGYADWFSDMKAAAYLPRISFMAFLDGITVSVIFMVLIFKIRAYIRSRTE